MPTRRNAFNEVKGLLGRLDRSIDEARAKRLGDDDAELTPDTRSSVIGEDHLDVMIGGGVTPATAPPKPAAKALPEAEEADDTVNRSKYGRARPLRRPSTPNNGPIPGSTPGSDPTGIWSE